jgi:hypothetical protein
VGFVFDIKAGFGPGRTTIPDVEAGLSELSVVSGVSGVRLQGDVWI